MFVGILTFFCHCSFTASVDFLFLSFAKILAERSAVLISTLFGEDLVISFHARRPHSLPMF